MSRGKGFSSYLFIGRELLGMIVYTCNLSIPEAVAERL